MLTGKTIGQLNYLSSPTADTLFPVELSGATYHIDFSSITNNLTFEDVTYAELYDKYTGQTFVAGSYYRITDFQTCYDQPDYDYDGNPIITSANTKTADVDPIIVFATSNSTLAENAYQPSYPKDSIKYDITFTVTEKTASPAKGRITERIDEFNNRTDYDHRTILFKRYRYYEIRLSDPYQGTVTVSVSIASPTEMVVSGTGTNFLSSISVGNKVGFEPNNNDYRVYEVTNVTSDTEMTITGLTSTVSLTTKMYSADWDEYASYKQNNVDDPSSFEEYYTFDGDDNFNNYIGNHANLYDWNGNDFLLANNVFHDRFQGNKFGDECYNNTFFDDCHDNNIGNNFYNNITDDDFDANVIGNNFHDNKITANFQYNRIGVDFEYNYIVQNSFNRNNIMNDFRYNEISGGSFQNNEIGSQFNNNKIKQQFYKNDIGNGFNQNNIYWGASGNLIGNAFNNNDIYCEFYDNVIGEYYESNNLGDINNPSNYGFYENKIGSAFRNNNITGQTYSNVIGNVFESNTLTGNTFHNTIGNYFGGNIIGNNFAHNQIGNYFQSNTIDDDFGFGGGAQRGNKIGNAFSNNNVGEYFYDNILPDNCQNNTMGDYFQWNVFNTSVFGVDFTEYYGNVTAFTYSALGSTASDNTYNGVGGTTNGNGIDATFNIEVSGGSVIGITGNTQGKLYFCGDTITILGSQIGGTDGVDDIIIYVGITSPKPSVYETYTCQIFERQGGGKRLSYYDSSDILTITDINV
jgi:hypothetical protein